MKTAFLYPFLALALFVGVHSVTARAQGTAFTYQGRLQNNGSPANGFYDFQFVLSNAPSGGRQIGYTVTETGIGVTNGLFTATLDFGEVFSGSALYLGVSVCSNGVGNYQNLSPLQELTPTPYAITAEGLSATAQLNLPGLVIQQNTNGAPNLIGGSPANYVSGGIVGATIGGGGAANYNSTLLINSVGGDFGTVGGGAQNNVIGQYGTVSGGSYNTAGSVLDTQSYDTVGGGSGNIANGGYSTVGGGLGNTATSFIASVAGGNDNMATGEGAAVGGGFRNVASDSWATVGGGDGNYAQNNGATVPGGESNIAGGQYSFAAGYGAQATNDGAFVWADYEGPPFSSTTTNQFSVRANGGVVFVTEGAGMTIDGQPVLTGSTQGTFSAPVSIAGTSFTAAPNTSYVATNASLTTINLPATANVGDIVQVSGTGAGGWQVSGDIAGLQGGFIWTETSAPTNVDWESVASSADGTHLAAIVYGGGIYTSVNSGVTWTEQTSGPLSSEYWTSVASSADGTHLVAAVSQGLNTTPDLTYTSTDSGSNWTEQTDGLAYLLGKEFVASSADGTHLVAVTQGTGTGPGLIYTSTNSGVIWTSASFPFGTEYETWNSVASSADGTHLVAVCYNQNFTLSEDVIYTSSDSGSDWTEQTSALLPVDWNSVASSADGTRLVAAAYGGGIYTSVDSGVNWTEQTNGLPAAADWNSIGSSANGTRLVAVAHGGGIYISVDGGSNWTEQTSGPLSSAAWNSVASSADGSRLVAVANGGGIYTEFLMPALVNGSAGSSEQFQYLGNGVWQPVQANVVAGLNIDPSDQNTGTVSADALTFGSSSGEGIASDRTNNGTQYDLEFYTAFNNRMEILNNGNVGIETTNPQASLDVAGGIHARGGTPGAFGVNNNGYFFGSPGDNDSGMSSLGDDQVEFYCNNSEVMRLTNGLVGIGTASPAYPLQMGSGAYCSAAGEWASISDRNVKEDFTAITPTEVLAKVAAMPITQWKYKVEPNGIKHIGPVAQDFHAAFGLGDSDKAIGSVDESGVALAAIQGLNQKLEETQQAEEAKEAEIQTLEKKLDELQAAVKQLVADK